MPDIDEKIKQEQAYLKSLCLKMKEQKEKYEECRLYEKLFIVTKGILIELVNNFYNYYFNQEKYQRYCLAKRLIQLSK